MRFHCLAYADVTDRRRHQGAFGTYQRAQHDLDRKLTAVLPLGDEFDPGPDLLRRRIFRRAQIVGDQPFRKSYRDDIRDLLPKKLVAAIAELLLRLNIQQHDLPALVDHHHRVRSGVKEPAVAAFHLRQVRFRSLAHADVADCGRHQGAFNAYQRAEHDLDRKLTAVLPPGDKFDPCIDPLRQRVFRGAEIVRDQPFREAHRNDVRYLLPKKLVAAIAELLLRLNIQQDDLPSLVDHHHRVGRRFQETAVPALHLRQMHFRGLAYADIADRRRHQDSFNALERAQHDLNRKLTAVLAPRNEFYPGPDLLRQRVFRRPQIVRAQPFRKALGNDVRNLLPKQFIAVVTELLFRLHIQQHDLAA